MRMYARTKITIVATVVFALTGKTEGQAKKTPPPPKIIHKIENANALFDWRHACYVEGVKHYDPKVAGGGAAYQKLVGEYNTKINRINELAAQPNTIVHFRYKAGVGANLASPFTSAVAYTNPKQNFSDIIFFQQQPKPFLPAVGRPVEIDGIYNPGVLFSPMPGFPSVTVPYQGTQITLYSVTKVGK